MKLENWREKFDELIKEYSTKEFEWGKCDCLLFVSDAAFLQCGIDPMSKKLAHDPDTIRGAYKTKREAYVLIKKYRDNIEGIMDLHFPRIAPAYASRGDIVLAQIESNNPFGLAFGQGLACFKTEDVGLFFTPIEECKTAWKIA